ncbi:MAG: hypothetical protein E5X60_16815 [Mesorhizobium sp.]|nr:MAG: hypothetical protein E5X60_16815 [Mesorhizobium sp.]
MRHLDDLQKLADELIAEAQMLRERCRLSREQMSASRDELRLMVHTARNAKAEARKRRDENSQDRP